MIVSESTAAISIDQADRGALTPAEARSWFRAGHWQSSTRGFSLGYLQCGLVVLPASEAADFLLFCNRNPQALPFLRVTEPGQPLACPLAPSAELRSALPPSHVYRAGARTEAASETTPLPPAHQH